MLLLILLQLRAQFAVALAVDGHQPTTASVLPVGSDARADLPGRAETERPRAPRSRVAAGDHRDAPHLAAPPKHARVALFSTKVPFAADMPLILMIGVAVIGMIAFIAVAGIGFSEFSSLILQLGFLLVGFFGACALIIAFRDGFNEYGAFVLVALFIGG